MTFSPKPVTLGSMAAPSVAFTVRYFAVVVAELVASGLGPDDVERAVEMLIADAHRDHPAVLDEAVLDVRANLNAALAVLRG